MTVLPMSLSVHEVIAELTRADRRDAALPRTDALFPDESDPPPQPYELMIGVLHASWGLSRARNGYWQPLIRALRARLVASSCSLLTQGFYASTDRTDPLRQSFADRALEAGVDGVVVAALDARDPEVADVIAAGIPAVFVDTEGADGCGFVMSDGRAGMEAVVAHLAASGRTRIAHVAGPLGNAPAMQRLEGFRAGLERAGLRSPTQYLESGYWSWQAGYDAAGRLLALAVVPDAIAAASDFQAVGVIAAIQDAGLRVPEDIAVTGFDGMPFSLAMRPQLTTLVQDPALVGRTAAEGLLQMLEQPAAGPFTALIPVELEVRGSST